MPPCMVKYNIANSSIFEIFIQFFFPEATKMFLYLNFNPFQYLKDGWRSYYKDLLNDKLSKIILSLNEGIVSTKSKKILHKRQKRILRKFSDVLGLNHDLSTVRSKPEASQIFKYSNHPVHIIDQVEVFICYLSYTKLKFRLVNFPLQL